MLLFQPDDGAFGDAFSKEIRSGRCRRYQHLSILVAYARHSGVARMAPAMSDFIAAGGTISAAVGLDQRQTTIEALELLKNIGATVSVFFDEDASRTYHPKIYLLEGARSVTWMAVGSNNLTAGGLYLNYEASTVLSGRDAARAARNAGLRSALAGGGSPHSRLLDAALFQSLIDNGYILPEKHLRDARASSAGARAKGATAFPRSQKPPLPAIDPKFRLKATKKQVPPAAANPLAPISAPPPAAPRSGFWKRLSKWDVSLKSSPGQMIIPHLFRSRLPATGANRKMPGGAMQAEVHFDIQYVDDGKPPVDVQGVRLIAYTPSPKHPRTNIDLRFTFLDRNISQTLKAGDVLEFFSNGNPVSSMTVVRTPAAKVTINGASGVIP